MWQISKLYISWRVLRSPVRTTNGPSFSWSLASPGSCKLTNGRSVSSENRSSQHAGKYGFLAVLSHTEYTRKTNLDHDQSRFMLKKSRQKPSLLRDADMNQKWPRGATPVATFGSMCVTLARILQSGNNSILYLRTIEDFDRWRPVVIFTEFLSIVLRQLNGWYGQ